MRLWRHTNWPPCSPGRPQPARRRTPQQKKLRGPGAFVPRVSLCVIGAPVRSVLNSNLKIVRAKDVLGKIEPDRPTVPPLASISNAVAVFSRRAVRQRKWSTLENSTAIKMLSSRASRARRVPLQGVICEREICFPQQLEALQ